MVTHINSDAKAEVRFDCGCFIGPQGGVYCCGRHYRLVKILHTDKPQGDPPPPREEVTDGD